MTQEVILDQDLGREEVRKDGEGGLDDGRQSRLQSIVCDMVFVCCFLQFLLSLCEIGIVPIRALCLFAVVIDSLLVLFEI